MKFDRSLLLLLPPAIYLFVLPVAHTTGLRNAVFAISVLVILLAWRTIRLPPIPLKIPLRRLVWICLAVPDPGDPPEVLDRRDQGRDRVRLPYVPGVLSLNARDARFGGVVHGPCSIRSVRQRARVYPLLPWRNPYHVGSYGGTLHFAAYLNTVFPVFIVMALTAAGKRRALVLLIIAMLLLTAYGSTSRAVWIALVVELAAFGGLYLARMDVKPNVRRMIADLRPGRRRGVLGRPALRDQGEAPGGSQAFPPAARWKSSPRQSRLTAGPNSGWTPSSSSRNGP